MKRKTKAWFSRALIVTLLVCGIPFHSQASDVMAEEATAQDTEIVASKQVDPWQVTSEITSVQSWKEHIKKKNQQNSPDALTHDSIQTVLWENGIIGLSKYQYHQLLKDEGLGEFAPDELLISFIDGKRQCKNDGFNRSFVSMTPVADIYYLAKLPLECDEKMMLQTIEKLIEDPFVSMVQANFRYEYASSYVSDQTYEYSLTAALEQVGVPHAHDFTTGSGITAGMIDSGAYDYGGQHLVAGSEKDNCPKSSTGHGTAVSTVIGGNGKYTGVAPDVRIICRGGCDGCKKNDDSKHGEAYTDQITSEINYIKNASCRVVNLSFGGDSDYLNFFPTLLEAENNNILFVHSAGIRVRM